MAGTKYANYRSMQYLRPEIEGVFEATLAEAIKTEDPSKYRPTPLNKDRQFLFDFNGSLTLDSVIRNMLTKIRNALSKGISSGLEDLPETLRKQIEEGDIGNNDIFRLVIEGYRCRVHYEISEGRHKPRKEDLLLEVPVDPHIHQLCVVQRDGKGSRLDAVPYEVANEERNGSEYPIGRFLGLNINGGSSKTLSKLCEWLGLEITEAQNNLFYQFVVYVRIGAYAKESKKPDDPARRKLILGTERNYIGNGDRPLNLADIQPDEEWDLGKGLLGDTQPIDPTANGTPTPPTNPINEAATPAVDPGAETNYATSPATKTPTSTRRRRDSTRTTRFELNPDKPTTPTKIEIPRGRTSRTSRWESFQI